MKPSRKDVEDLEKMAYTAKSEYLLESGWVVCNEWHTWGHKEYAAHGLFDMDEAFFHQCNIEDGR